VQESVLGSGTGQIYEGEKMKGKTSVSEVHAYIFILDELTKKKGWSKEQVFTQQECHTIKPIGEALGATKPENVVKVNEKTYYVIESKNERKKIDQALKEAREDYAGKINKQGKVRASFVTGIAGSSNEGFISKSQYLLNGNWENIQENGIDVTGLLSKAQIESGRQFLVFGRLYEQNRLYEQRQFNSKVFKLKKKDKRRQLHLNKDIMVMKWLANSVEHQS
jgi:hypothetical protein